MPANQRLSARRRFLLRSAATIVSTAVPGLVSARPPISTPAARLDNGTPYRWDKLIERARMLAAAEFQSESPATVIRDWIDRLHAHHPGGIRMISQAFLGAHDDAPFQFEGLYPDNRQRPATTLYLVDNGQARQWIFRGNQFRYGEAAVATNAPQNLFYGGLAIWLPGDRAPFAVLDGRGIYGVAVVPGQFGTRSALLRLNPTQLNAEESLRARAIYIHRPTGRWQPLTIDVLVDSAPVAGAVRIELTRAPDGRTRIAHQQHWFVRDARSQLGLAPQLVAPRSNLHCPAATSLAEATSATRLVRPVHTGVCLRDDRHQQLWRPLSLGEQATLTVFDTRKPTGYGLVQRFADMATDPAFAPSDRLPQCWTSPDAQSWPQGHLQLIERPAAAESTVKKGDTGDDIRNLSAHLLWVPTTEVINRAVPLNVRFTQDWQLDVAPALLTTKLAVCGSQLHCSGDGRGRQLKVSLDFSGPALARRAAALDLDLSPRVHSDRGEMVSKTVRIVTNGDQRIARLQFTVLATGPEPIGLRAQLLDGNQIVSEIWLFTYLPGLKAG